MTSFSKHQNDWLWWLPFIGITAFLLAIYVSSLANGLVLGDPTEYTFVAHVLGIAHPPGYAFITLIGHLFQRIIPLGTIAWRMHLLAAVSGTLCATAAAGIFWHLRPTYLSKSIASVMAIATAALIGTAVNHWQHAIHANPHIITATFLAVNTWLLLQWQTVNKASGGRAGWGYLWLFCLSTGLGVTHHPLTVFSFPAYTVFILTSRPTIWREWPRWGAMIGFAAIGLLPLLYYPIRSAMEPAVGPHTMDTLNGFLDHVLARGLSENLEYYGWADINIRLRVFVAIARLQFGGMLLIFAPVGMYALWHQATRSSALLILIAFFSNYLFVISLREQDIMAYLLGPLWLTGLFITMGVVFVGQLIWKRWHPARPTLAISTVLAILLLGRVLFIYPAVSLSQFDEGDDFVIQVFDYFANRGENATLLINWEFMTPLWYTQFIDQEWPNPTDVKPTFVSAADPWLPSVFNTLPGGPVYLNGYRREIVDAGFRLRPRGPFYQVVEPGDATIPEELTLVDGRGDGIDLVAYGWSTTAVQPGDFVKLTLAMRVPQETNDFYAPVVEVGDIRFAHTTDSHLITPAWRTGEVIVERFDFALPHGLTAGDYPVTVRLRNLSQDTDSGLTVRLPSLQVQTTPESHLGYRPQTDQLLANFRQRVGLRSAYVWDGWRRYESGWQTPIQTQAGDELLVIPEWQLLQTAEESYTIFVHLIDAANRPLVALDYTPLGGAVPTHLWFPKWIPGQRLQDPYRLVITPDLPPGTYYIEVGLYEMTSGRRLHMHDQEGNIIGDRYILGAIVIE